MSITKHHNNRINKSASLKEQLVIPFDFFFVLLKEKHIALAFPFFFPRNTLYIAAVIHWSVAKPEYADPTISFSKILWQKDSSV